MFWIVLGDWLIGVAVVIMVELLVFCVSVGRLEVELGEKVNNRGQRARTEGLLFSK